MASTMNRPCELTLRAQTIAEDDKKLASLIQEFQASVTSYSRLAQQVHGRLSQYGWTKKESTELLNSNVREIYSTPNRVYTYRGVSYESTEK